MSDVTRRKLLGAGAAGVGARTASATVDIRRRVFADQWTSAQDLANQAMLGTPAGQLAYQTAGNLRLAFGSSSGTLVVCARCHTDIHTDPAAILAK